MMDDGSQEFGFFSGLVKGDLVSVDLSVALGNALRYDREQQQRLLVTVLGKYCPIAIGPRRALLTTPVPTHVRPPQGESTDGEMKVWDHRRNKMRFWRVRWWPGYHHGATGRRIEILVSNTVPFFDESWVLIYEGPVTNWITRIRPGLAL
jgi:hypothetical protein